MSRVWNVRQLWSCVVLCGLSCGTVSAGEFPLFEKLPVRPEPPDPLVMLDGTPVRTRDDWFNKRRPELKALFEHYM